MIKRRCGRNYGGKVAINLRFMIKVKLFKIHPFKDWIHFVGKKNTKVIVLS